MSSRSDVLIAPSLLSADFSRLGEQIAAVEEAGADWLHLDVMDGNFVPNITIGPLVVEAVKHCARVPLDVHLMIATPDQYIKDFRSAGADILSIHPEACVHLHRALGEIRDSGMKAGVALNPSTCICAIENVLAELDVVMVMTVNPGFGGQSFIPTMFSKIKAIRKMIDESGYDILLEVDGGVGPKNSSELTRAGADVLVAGSAVFGKPPYKTAISNIRNGEVS
ncbi:MAG: ribulose-phosphate 3-epimerase [Deltaproteobacteria bacterium]|nr:ribulose-phosphate 3-epimerase [Deltaproteobacteria bacterium]